MKAPRRVTRCAAIEILPSQLRLAILEPRGEESIAVVTHAHHWRQSALSLGTDEGRLELAAALRQLSSQFRLSNVPLTIALSGDFCVTRVVTGLNDAVRRELAELEQRSSLYLSLGHGVKATSSCVMPIDARHQRAMLAVANDRVLGSIADALHRSGLHAEIFEPALVSLCRLIGKLEADSEHPTLVVRGDERGVEVGISYGGQLLLDYRPAARQAKEQAGEIIGSHLHRLQRYCERYVRVAEGKLSTVYVSGDPEVINLVDRGLAASGLAIHSLSPQSLDPRWEVSGASHASEFAAAMGAALLGLQSAQPKSYVNLIDRKRARGRTPLVPALIKALWPVAAVLMVSLAGFTAMQVEGYRFRQLDARLVALQPQQAEARLLRMRALADQQEIAHLQRIAQRLHSPDWDELATSISRCLPEDVWLDDIRVDGQGRLQLAGASFTEDGVFEFVRWLEKLPALKRVALSGTRPTRLEMGPATQFDVRCDFSSASTGQEGKSNDNG